MSRNRQAGKPSGYCRVRADERDYLATVIDGFDPSIALGTETPSYRQVPLLRGH
jgi:hypothetical protein